MGENEMIQRLWNKDCLKKAVALAESELAGRAKIYRFSDWHRVSSWVLAAESSRGSGGALYPQSAIAGVMPVFGSFFSESAHYKQR